MNRPVSDQPARSWPASGVGSTEWYVGHLRADAERMARAYEHGPIDAPVAACPGWDATALVDHLSYIHRWADLAFRNSRAPAEGEVPVLADGAGVAERADWLRTGAEALADDFGAGDPLGPTWHVFPIERTNWVWIRRQAIETTLHRWDAEMAMLGASSLDPALAREGVAEYIEVAVPRIAQRSNVTLPDSTLCLDCVDGDIGAPQLLLGPGSEATATLRGTSESLLLLLMNRAGRDRVEVAGDAAVPDAWLSIPGW